MSNETLEGFRLSPQQKRLWTLQQLTEGIPYRVQAGILIEGNLNKEALNLALQKVVNIHEILRTNFKCLPGMTIPLQVINDYCPLEIDEHDLTNLELEIQESKTDFIFQEMIRQPLDLEKGSTLSAALVTWSADKHILLLSLSAMNADKTTLVNLVEEINNCYSATLLGKEIDEEPLQYADIAEWQYELLSENTAQGKEYWQKVNLSNLSNIHLFFERKTKLNLEFEPKLLGLKLSPTISKDLAALAESHGISYKTFLLACWQVLIWKLTAQSDLVVGIACNGRKYEELEPALGLLSKYVPLQCQLDEQLPFSQLLQQVHQADSDACKWQEYFQWDDFIFKSEETLPFLPICFEFKQVDNQSCNAGVSFSIYKHYSCITKFKIKLSCLQKNNEIHLQFYYDASLYDLIDIKGIAEYFETLLISAVSNPELTIGELELLKDATRQQLLTDFNNTSADYPGDKCIHQLFEEQAARTPDKIAVVFENQQLTYKELNEKVNQLANYLQKLEIKPEVIVGICLERSLEIVIAILGILKAGGAYLPLDATMPTERLKLMLQDAQTPVLLTQQHLVNKLGDACGGLRLRTPNTICLDTDWEKIAQESHQNCSSIAATGNLAYVIYTSGSTGKPKGVAVEHQQILNYLYGILPRLDLAVGSSFAMVSTFAADLGNTAIFPALSTGSCLHIISQNVASDPETLAAYFEHHSIDCLKIVPSHLAALLTSPKAASILPRKCLVLGGEATNWELIDRIREYAPNCPIINHYGPTESTVGVLTYQVGDNNLRYISETVPIGRPIGNTQIYILDSHLRPVPIGVTGELYIGGDSLARGYLNQPEITAEKFIVNPFSDRTNARIYKTGDAARYLPDGNIEFLGRIDNQIKIRGFRIELGEIEATIRQHPDIKQVVVIAREDVPGEKRIVAYIVPRVETLHTNSMREILQQKLPDYMIPSAFVQLKALPLTANGKIDRQALPAPDQVILTDTFVAPRNPVEETLASIWAEVLKIEKIGIYHNFFELGGHSLLATKVISRLRQAFQIDLPLHHIFESPTFADLAVVIAHKLSEQADEKMMAEMVAELEQLSEVEVQKLLANGGIN
ncbi:amino acid adenylation domain protein [Crinalium epipsammum PCC 9333]|uniref:Amino acid adenylation domain protein n=1 Tax=Crinalium epipsammum PCC 9333 TaxID=1173022 RepID=K9VUM9_9CYAN|nr:non-ribosomal peptide synthetase [Crinalium epipsammum]AFZ11269.1 amino acid adenylation domain protein [Crinalium epipsammum PCC 9333]